MVHVHSLRWLEGKDLAPSVLNRMFCTSQEPFQIRIAPVSVPSGKAAHLSTGTQEHNQPRPAETQHRYLVHKGTFIFLYIQLELWQHVVMSTYWYGNWVQLDRMLYFFQICPWEEMKYIHLSKYAVPEVLTDPTRSRCASKDASGTWNESEIFASYLNWIWDWIEVPASSDALKMALSFAEEQRVYQGFPFANKK